jgi:NADPH:quinone reductase-like Zn-dependent oxidoreductase
VRAKSKHKHQSADTFKLTSKTLDEVLSLVEARVYRPVIDRILSLDKIQEAHRLVDSGRKKGSVVIQM